MNPLNKVGILLVLICFLSCKKSKENKHYYIQTSNSKDYLIELKEYTSKVITVSNSTYDKLDVISKKGNTCIGDVHFFNSYPAQNSTPASEEWVNLSLNGDLKNNKLTGKCITTNLTTLSNTSVQATGTFTLDFNKPVD